jgi:hypothetical protein
LPTTLPSAPVASGVGASASLFDLDEPARPHRLRVDLTADEWESLQRRARDAGTAPEEVVRTLLRDAPAGRLVR